MKKYLWIRKESTDLSVIVDRLAVRDGIAQRLSDSVETALKLADGLVEINVINGETQLYSEHFACSDCGISLPEIEPRLFPSITLMVLVLNVLGWA